MRFWGALGVIAFLCLNSGVSFAQQAASDIKQALAFAAGKDFARAEEFLQRGEKAAPGDPEVRAARAKVLLWKGDYAHARESIDRLVADFPQNPDYLLLRASWFLYRGELDSAERDYSSIVARYPDYVEAKDGAEAVRRQRAEKERGIWKLDTGGGVITFQHSGQPNWHNEYLQVTRAFDDKRLFVHARGERFSQYDKVDALYEVGATRKFSDGLYADAALSGSSEAVYKPVFRAQFGTNGRLTKENLTYFPVWALFTFQNDWYEDLENRSFSLGPQVVLAEDWSVLAKMIYAYQVDGKSTRGWITRMDGRLFPALKFMLGYSYSPDLEAASITAVDTAFGSLRYDVTDRLSMQVGYSREDRAEAYIRNIIDVGLSYSF